MPHAVPLHLVAVLAGVVSLGGTAMAADPISLTLKDHHFTPTDVTAPANERFRIQVVNQDPTPSEFESSDLRIEKIVVPGGKITVMAGPLKPGKYAFFDDYNPDQAKGTLTAVATPAGK
ncbi:cupredoxin domain-containing protein [Acidisphaera sp. S103]|uniref:cupredoxin domain-containing protein n=1 Tax=Acidisphaera sp. S103 TaxID=1747223 RepID=UPI00131C129A